MTGALGCAGRKAEPPTPPAAAGPQLPINRDRFDLDINRYVNLPPSDPQRPTLARRLHLQIAQAVDDALTRQDPGRAAHALRTLGLMYRPAELDNAAPSPELARSTFALYELAARRGDEQSALLAVAVLHFVGSPSDRSKMKAQWPDFFSWLSMMPDPQQRPAFASPLRVILQTSLAYWPSPWTADLLQESYRKELRTLRSALANAADPKQASALRENMGQIYYWMIRVDLRRGDLRQALDNLEDLRRNDPALYPQFSNFADLFSRALEPNLQPGASLELLEKLNPTTLEGPDWIMHDSWSTIRALSFPLLQGKAGNHQALAHLHLARALRGQGLSLASVSHYQQVLDQVKDREVWTELALAHSESLETQSRYDLKAAKAHFQEIERFYALARKYFEQSPLKPGLNDARMRMIHALFDAGEIDQSARLSRESLALAPQPEALRLLAMIAMHRGEFEAAAKSIVTLRGLSYRDPMQAERWAIVAELLEAKRRLLQDGSLQSARPHAKIAQAELNKLLEVPGVDAPVRAGLYMQRFEARMLGEYPEQAFADLQQALRSAPENASIYLQAMSDFWLYGRVSDAHHLFSRARSQSALDPVEKVYLALWLMDLAKAQQDQSALADARSYLEQNFADPWTASLASFATGKLDALALRSAAKNKRQRSEAQFYIGLDRAQRGDGQGARSAFDAVAASEMMSLVEYRMAKLAPFFQLPTRR